MQPISSHLMGHNKHLIRKKQTSGQMKISLLGLNLAHLLYSSLFNFHLLSDHSPSDKVIKLNKCIVHICISERVY